MTIAEFGRQLRRGDITSEQALESCLQRIDADNALLNAFILVVRDDALEQARAADRDLAAGHDRGPLHGVPISIKDLIDITGVPTTAASRVREGHVALRDAAVIAQLRNAGSVFVGKTNLHEFGFGTTNEDSAFGPVRNPYDVTRSSGGSSGGSAVSVAAGMALGTIGTDTGGSIRIPAAACGLAGLKPGHGEISMTGIVPVAPTLDHVGPLAKDVADLAIVYRALLGAAPRPLEPLPLDGLRMAVLRPYLCDLLDHDVRQRFEEAIDELRAAGARIIDDAIEHASDTGPVYMHISLAEAGAYHRPTLDAIPERYTPGVRQRLEWGRHVLAEDYVRALAGRDVLQREVDALLTNYHALVLPTLAIPAPPIGATSVRVGQTEMPIRNVMLRLTQLFDLTGHPAVALPCGLTGAGLPCSLQLVGGRGATERLLEIALACERLITAHAVPRSGSVGG